MTSGDPQPCPVCEEQYQRLGQHWAMSSTCEPPDLPETAGDVLTGLALAGASTYRGPGSTTWKFRAVTQYRERARWWDNELVWVSSGVRLHKPGVEESSRTTRYQVSTVAHPELARLAWTRADGVPPRETTLSPRGVRAWLSHGAGLSFDSGARPRLQFGARASAERRERIAGVLRELDCGLDPTVTDRVVVLSVAETARLQAFSAPPAPGSEYKWAESRAAYEAARSE